MHYPIKNKTFSFIAAVLFVSPGLILSASESNSSKVMMEESAEEFLENTGVLKSLDCLNSNFSDFEVSDDENEELALTLDDSHTSFTPRQMMNPVSEEAKEAFEELFGDGSIGRDTATAGTTTVVSGVPTDRALLGGVSSTNIARFSQEPLRLRGGGRKQKSKRKQEKTPSTTEAISIQDEDEDNALEEEGYASNQVGYKNQEANKVDSIYSLTLEDFRRAIDKFNYPNASRLIIVKNNEGDGFSIKESAWIFGVSGAMKDENREILTLLKSLISSEYSSEFAERIPKISTLALENPTSLSARELRKILNIIDQKYAIGVTNSTSTSSSSSTSVALAATSSSTLSYRNNTAASNVLTPGQKKKRAQIAAAISGVASRNEDIWRKSYTQIDELWAEAEKAENSSNLLQRKNEKNTKKLDKAEKGAKKKEQKRHEQSTSKTLLGLFSTFLSMVAGQTAVIALVTGPAGIPAAGVAIGAKALSVMISTLSVALPEGRYQFALRKVSHYQKEVAKAQQCLKDAQTTVPVTMTNAQEGEASIRDEELRGTKEIVQKLIPPVQNIQNQTTWRTWSTVLKVSFSLDTDLADNMALHGMNDPAWALKTTAAAWAKRICRSAAYLKELGSEENAEIKKMRTLEKQFLEQNKSPEEQNKSFELLISAGKRVLRSIERAEHRVAVDKEEGKNLLALAAEGNVEYIEKPEILDEEAEAKGRILLNNEGRGGMTSFAVSAKKKITESEAERVARQRKLIDEITHTWTINMSRWEARAEADKLEFELQSAHEELEDASQNSRNNSRSVDAKTVMDEAYKNWSSAYTAWEEAEAKWLQDANLDSSGRLVSEKNQLAAREKLEIEDRDVNNRLRIVEQKYKGGKNNGLSQQIINTEILQDIKTLLTERKSLLDSFEKANQVSPEQADQSPERALATYAEDIKNFALRAARENFLAADHQWWGNNLEESLRVWQKVVTAKEAPEVIEKAKKLMEADKEANKIFHEEKKKFGLIEAVWIEITETIQRDAKIKEKNAAESYAKGNWGAWFNLLPEERKQYNNDVMFANEMYALASERALQEAIDQAEVVRVRMEEKQRQKAIQWTKSNLEERKKIKANENTELESKHNLIRDAIQKSQVAEIVFTGVADAVKNEEEPNWSKAEWSKAEQEAK
ncbi:MAG TPA: hypothetical protein VJK54_03625, partial [Chthoniobacterales bacterium]|nr:hypothetical protein [Chthoniobacterales bacterium]